MISCMKEDSQLYMILAHLELESVVTLSDVPIACEFLEVFPDHVSTLSPERDRV